MVTLLRLERRRPARQHGPRSEVEVIAELGSRVLGTTGQSIGSQCVNTSEIRAQIARMIPGFETTQHHRANEAGI